jgi:hypothetical protein
MQFLVLAPQGSCMASVLWRARVLSAVSQGEGRGPVRRSGVA